MSGPTLLPLPGSPDYPISAPLFMDSPTRGLRPTKIAHPTLPDSEQESVCPCGIKRSRGLSLPATLLHGREKELMLSDAHHVPGCPGPRCVPDTL